MLKNDIDHGGIPNQAEAGHQLGCRSEASTPSEAAIKSPANGARWRNGNKGERAKALSRCH
jgi:hypothetical protein